MYLLIFHLLLDAILQKNIYIAKKFSEFIKNFEIKKIK